MALASTSKAQLSYKEELVFGEVQSGAPKNLRMTGESLNYDIGKAISEEINATRQTADSVHVSATADGGVEFETIYREYDPFMEALLASTFAAFGTDGVKTLTCDFDSSANTIACVTAAAFTGLAAGSWVGVQGAGVNSGFYKIGTTATNLLTLDASTPLKASASAVESTISQSTIANGTAALRTFTLQKYFSDVTQYFVYRGMGVNTMSLNFATGSILTGSLAFMGKDSARAGTTFFSTTAAAATAFGIMSPVTGVGRVLLDGAVLSGTYLKSADVNVNANLRGQDALGYLGNVGLGEGTFEIGGNMSIYLNDGSIYDSAIADNFVSVELPVMDVAGNGYVFVFGNVKLGVPTVQAGSKDNDVMLDMDFTAHAPNMATDKMLKVYRLGAAGA